LILHPTSVVGALLGFSVGLISHGLNPTLLGGLAGLLIMLALYLLGVLFSWFRTRRLRAAGLTPDHEEALGAGDVILAAVLGLVLGWPLIGFGLFLGVLLGGIFGAVIMLSLLISRRYGKQALLVFMPYGPFFVASAFAIVFFPRWVAGLLQA
jgi:leader peptidase (prepilin peptidase)/N-methyltransferase